MFIKVALAAQAVIKTDLLIRTPPRGITIESVRMMAAQAKSPFQELKLLQLVS